MQKFLQVPNFCSFWSKKNLFSQFLIFGIGDVLGKYKILVGKNETFIDFQYSGIGQFVACCVSHLRQYQDLFKGKIKL